MKPYASHLVSKIRTDYKMREIEGHQNLVLQYGGLSNENLSSITIGQSTQWTRK
jgi:hypothetical protein